MAEQTLTPEQRIERAYAPWQQGKAKIIRGVAIALFKDYHQHEGENIERWQKYGPFVGDPSFGLSPFAFSQGNTRDFLDSLDKIAIDTAIATERDFLLNIRWMPSKRRDPLKGPKTGNNFIPYLAEKIGSDCFGNRYFPKGLRGEVKRYAFAANQAAKNCDRLRNLGCDIWWPVAFPEIYNPPLDPQERDLSVLIRRLLDLQNKQARYFETLPNDHPKNKEVARTRDRFILQRRKRATENPEVMARLKENYIQTLESCGETLVNFYEYIRLLIAKDLGIELPKRIID